MLIYVSELQLLTGAQVCLSCISVSLFLSLSGTADVSVQKMSPAASTVKNALVIVPVPISAFVRKNHILCSYSRGHVLGLALGLYLGYLLQRPYFRVRVISWALTPEAMVSVTPLSSILTSSFIFNFFVFTPS